MVWCPCLYLLVSRLLVGDSLILFGVVAKLVSDFFLLLLFLAFFFTIVLGEVLCRVSYQLSSVFGVFSLLLHFSSGENFVFVAKYRWPVGHSLLQLWLHQDYLVSSDGLSVAEALHLLGIIKYNYMRVFFAHFGRCLGWFLIWLHVVYYSFLPPPSQASLDYRLRLESHLSPSKDCSFIAKYFMIRVLKCSSRCCLELLER